MAFHIDTVIPDFFPDEASAVLAFDNVGLPITQIIESVEQFICNVELGEGGYQRHLSTELPIHLTNTLNDQNNRVTPDRKYSQTLNENADFVLKALNSQKKIFFEIEFRPNVEKDLIKFQIGHNCGILAAAVLILAIDRNTINSSYTTMPEFDKFVRLITELKPTYPEMPSKSNG